MIILLKMVGGEVGRGQSPKAHTSTHSARSVVPPQHAADHIFLLWKNNPTKSVNDGMDNLIVWLGYPIATDGEEYASKNKHNQSVASVTSHRNTFRFHIHSLKGDGEGVPVASLRVDDQVLIV